jgi:hypothetical protein
MSLMRQRLGPPALKPPLALVGAIDRLSGIGLVSVCASRGVDLPLNNLAADVGFNLRPRGIQLPAYHFFGCFTLRHSTSLAAVGLRPTN